MSPQRRETLIQLHARFGRPTLSRSLNLAHSAEAEVVTLSAATLAVEALRYNPGYVDAVLAAGAPIAKFVVAIKPEKLEAIRRQFAPGCCGH